MAVRPSAEPAVTQPVPLRPVTVAAGGTTARPFVLELGHTVPVHQHDLQAAVVADTRIHLARRPFWVAAG